MVTGSSIDPEALLSQREQQETGEHTEVSGVVVEPVAGRQTETDRVTLLQLQSHTVGRGGVAAVVVQVQVEEDWLVVPVQVQTHVAFQVICSCEAEEVKSSERSREDACRQEGLQSAAVCFISLIYLFIFIMIHNTTTLLPLNVAYV